MTKWDRESTTYWIDATGRLVRIVMRWFTSGPWECVKYDGLTDGALKSFDFSESRQLTEMEVLALVANQ